MALKMESGRNMAEMFKTKSPEQRKSNPTVTASTVDINQRMTATHSIHLRFLLKAIHKMTKAILSKYPDAILTNKKGKRGNSSINSCSDCLNQKIQG